MTVDRSYVLATHHFDRHSSYVALSRHREEARVFYAAEEFEDRYAKEVPTREQARHRFLNTLSRARPKELAHDYLDRDARFHSGEDKVRPPQSMADIDARQQQAAEHWRATQVARAGISGHRVAGPQLENAHRRSRGGPESELDP